MGAPGQISFFIPAAVTVILSILAVSCRKLTDSVIYLLAALTITAVFFLMERYFLLAIMQLVLYSGVTGLLFFYTIRKSNLTHLKANQHDWKRSLIAALIAAAAAAPVIITIINFRFHGYAKQGVTIMDGGITIHYFLILASIIFFTGIYGFLSHRNLISILISSELIINSLNINFTAFNRYLYPQKTEGMLFSIFIIITAVAGAALALAIIQKIFVQTKSVNINAPEE